jgi:hypothetical protein
MFYITLVDDDTLDKDEKERLVGFHMTILAKNRDRVPLPHL